jgi:signal transduction histidine kinase
LSLRREEQSYPALPDHAALEKETALVALCAGLSHELNNIFMVVQGNLSLMREIIDLPETGDEMVAEMLTASQRGIDLARKMQIYAGRATLWPETVDLRQIVEQTVAQLRETVLHDVSVEISLPGEACNVYLDPKAAGAALTELAVNARAGMAAGGTFAIDLRKIFYHSASASVRELSAPNFALLSMSDDGIGMSEEVLKRATEPMFSWRNMGDAKRGWGLSMVAGFARQSRGSILLDRAPIGGTRVAMYLPLSESAEPMYSRDESGEL